jgi:hypothetical protein
MGYGVRVLAWGMGRGRGCEGRGALSQCVCAVTVLLVDIYWAVIDIVAAARAFAVLLRP